MPAAPPAATLRADGEGGQADPAAARSRGRNVNPGRSPGRGGPAGPTDERLLLGSANGDLPALGLLYDRHRAAAYSLALRITVDPGAAADAVHDAFVAARRDGGRRRGGGRASVRTWLLAIVHQRAVDSIRRRRASELPGGAGSPPAGGALPEVWAALPGRLDRAAVVGGLATLPPDQAEALQLAYFDGFTVPEVAARLGVAPGTVASRLRLGLLGLRSALLVAAAAGETPAEPTRSGVRSAAGRRGEGPDARLPEAEEGPPAIEPHPSRCADLPDLPDLAPAYLLGALEPGAGAALRRHLASCSKPHPELAELGAVVSYLADAVEPLEPPPPLRERILTTAAADLRASRQEGEAADRLISVIGRVPAAESPVPATGAGPASPGVGGASASPPGRAALAGSAAAGRRRVPAAGGLLVAAAVAIVVLGAWDLSLRDQAAAVEARAGELRALVEAAAAAGAVRVPLAGTAEAPAATGLLVLPPSGPGYLVVRGLPTAPAGRTYEAWLIADGAARPAGTFAVASDGLGVLAGLRASGAVAAVAITQEPAGGGAQPGGKVLLRGSAGS